MRVSKGSNKKLFAIKVFKFRDKKSQQRFFLDEGSFITKKARVGAKLTASLFETVRPRTKGNSISPTNTVTRNWLYAVEGRTSHYYRDIKNTLIVNYVCLTVLKKTTIVVFHWKSFYIEETSLYWQKLSTTVITNFTNCIRTAT